MNFDDIKNKMNAESMENQTIPQHIKELKSTQLPLQKIRRNLRNEILIQIVVFISLFTISGLLEMNRIAKGLYFILLFIITLITIIYLLKMSTFLKRKLDISTSSKHVLITTIHELHLTLEVYKTAIISGSLILPFLVFVVYTGKGDFVDSTLYDLLTFEISTNTLLCYIIGYLLASIIIVFMTRWWTNLLYGKYLKNIEKTLNEMNVE
ncbi:hypothetical protein [Flavimarina sp. Hel_I_48]|uniref:hypothetical protein n=1 Tax=Flavimarina sp. Hel_I_48 TaxID=1392488 RepID=UPI0004DF7EF5|nr:hypothetical protein [Flavimarina sp. Hel_I_48]